jgi:hypothetical protein
MDAMVKYMLQPPHPKYPSDRKLGEGGLHNHFGCYERR